MKKYLLSLLANRRAIFTGLFIALLILGITWLGPLLLMHTKIRHGSTEDAAARPAARMTSPLSISKDTD